MKRSLKRLRFYLSWPGLALYFRRRPRARVAILDENGRVLLVQGQWKAWYGDDGWGLPGGGLDPGEEPAGGAARELSEELGLKVAASDLKLLARERIRDHGISYEAYLFMLPLKGRAAPDVQPGELVTLAWCAPEDLARYRLKADIKRVRQLLNI